MISVTMLAVAVTALATNVAAEAAWVNLMPNGANCWRNGVLWVPIGHTSASQAAATEDNINVFGEAFEDADEQWTKALCQADSDGDGYTNGQELGDPDCVWSVGKTPSRQMYISHPGYADSVPTTPVPTPAPTSAPTPAPTPVPPTPAPTTAAPPSTLVPPNALSTANKLATSPEMTALDGKMKYQWTVYDGSSTTTAVDDVLELVLTSTVDNQYVAFGTAPNKMDGPLVSCVVSSATSVAMCSDWTGSNYDIAPRTASAGVSATLLVSSQKRSAGGFTVTVRTMATSLGLKKGNVQRHVVAVGPYTVKNQPLQHSGNGRAALSMNLYVPGTAAPPQSSTTAAPDTASILDLASSAPSIATFTAVVLTIVLAL